MTANPKTNIPKQNIVDKDFNPHNPNPINHSLYAFWESINFPYLSYGPVVDIYSDGTMTIEDLPKEKRVLPILVLPFNAGVAMAKELDKRTQDYHQVSRSLMAKACRGVLDLNTAFYRVPEIVDQAEKI